LEPIIRAMLTQRFYLYCQDKAALKSFLAQPMPDELAGMLQVEVVDAYASSWRRFQEASHLRADARTIVTATILVLCMVMLYLLCRAQVQERLGLIAVYRLLGIPKRKLHGIFLMEAVLSALGTIVPTAAVCWLGIHLLSGVPELEINLILPWQAAVAVSGALLVYYVIVSLLPLAQLLRLPPARLAAKYDM
jgi:predicted lysophospholipase L1 biosynthesis ABC-type transport system permease subunit